MTATEGPLPRPSAPMHYFDFNATAPLHPAARAAWLEASDSAWHNPSSLFAAATAARELLAESRERVADLLGCAPERLLFTSGATAANNALARHLARVAPAESVAIISAIEHPCIDVSFRTALSGRVVEAVVDQHGVVRPEVVTECLDSLSTSAACVSVMAASNEAGTLQPWQNLASLCRSRGVPFHTDASQWLGKLPAAGLGECDWVTASAHKYGGHKGCGLLITPADCPPFRGDRGGPQEGGRHAGTENIAAIAAMAAALEAREREIAIRHAEWIALRVEAEQRLRAQLPEARVVGAGAERLWNTLAVVLPGGDGKKIVAHLARAGVAASTGSACSGGSGSIPRIVAAIGAEALGLPGDSLRGMVRLSSGWDTTRANWAAAIDALVAATREKIAPPAVDLRPAADAQRKSKPTEHIG